MGFHARFALANRKAVEDEIERLIALLDRDDAPFEDLEPDDDQCVAGDDGCGFFRLGDHSGWGAGERLARTLPRYGVDQSEGPINYREAERDHQVKLLGLQRSASGGWRHPR